jgi:hypothetical protein
MLKGYTNKEKIEKFLGITTTVDLNFFIETAEKIIEKLTGRVFIADETAVARTFGGNGQSTMMIDDCIEITKLEIGDDDYGGTFTEIDAGGIDGYFPLPENYAEKGIPITRVYLRANSFTRGIKNNRITAKWGYSQYCPADIAFVATAIAGGLYNSERGAEGAVKSESIGNYSVTYDSAGEAWSEFERAKEIIKQYKKYAV